MTYLSTPFRSFFLAASVSAAFSIPLWLLVLTGEIQLHTTLPAWAWHAHEMIYGFIGAVFAGFLLTASANWTGRKVIGGFGVSLLFALWLLARVTASTGLSFPLSEAVGCVFYLGTAFAIGRAIVAAGRWRNIGFPILLTVTGSCDLMIHLAAAGHIDSVWITRCVWVSLDAVAMSVLIFGGRILPMFSKNALGLSSVRPKGALDYAGVVSLMLLMAVHALGLSAKVESLAWSVAGTITLARLYGWGGTQTLRTPLLCVLHLGWMVCGLGMLLVAYALYAPLSLPPTSAHHLLFIGGFGTLILGMMARVSLGHTGRAKKASLTATISFVLIIVASIVRVIATFAGEHYVDLLYVAGACWSMSFLLFLIVFVPMLLRPRPDGKSG